MTMRDQSSVSLEQGKWPAGVAGLHPYQQQGKEEDGPIQLLEAFTEAFGEALPEGTGATTTSRGDL
jgi:hypothetical protein